MKRRFRAQKRDVVDEYGHLGERGFGVLVGLGNLIYISILCMWG